MIAQHARGAEAYRRVDAVSRSPLELVVMMYDGALASLTEAARSSGNRRARAAGVSKAMSIVFSLQESLNLADGGDVAAELDRLYTYMSGRLLDVTTKKDDTGIAEVHKLLTELRGAWQHIATAPAVAAPQQAATAASGTP